MAAHPSAGSDAAGEHDVPKSSITNYGSIADEAAYLEGQLSWADGKYVIKEEDIVTITRADASRAGHIIWSLAPANPPTETTPSPRPFELRSTPAITLPPALLDKYLFKSLPPQLNPSNNAIHVVISTLSGTQLSTSFFDDVLRVILEAVGLKDSAYTVLRTSSAESVSEFTKTVLLPEANGGKRQTVLLLSGDGGIVDTVNSLLGSGERSRNYIKPTFNLLPLGTGNALFHSLHRPSPLPSQYIQSLRTLLYGTPRPLPVFRAQFSPGARLLSNEGRTATPLVDNSLFGAVVASYGLHSTLVADSDTTEYRKHGAKRFGLVANDLLFPAGGAPPHPYAAEITLAKDGQDVALGKTEHGYVLASLVSNLEKTFTISPASTPLDGQLRVVHFGALSGEDTMNVMKEAYNDGNHVSLPEVTYERVAGLKIKFHEAGEDAKWRRCCIDGLIVSVEEGGWMEVRTVEKGMEAIDIVVDP